METTVDTFLSDSFTFNRFNNLYLQAKQMGHQHWIGDFPVHPKALELYKAFKAKRYNIVPRLDANIMSVRNEASGIWYNVCDGVGIAFPDAPQYAAGKLFISTTEKNDVVYNVYSKRIKNEKFRFNSDGYNTRTSKDLDKLLKVALKTLVPVGFEDLKEKYKRDLDTGIGQIRAPARNKLYEATRVGCDTVNTEVANMIAAGYQPVTNEFRAAFDLIANEGAELKRVVNYKPRACFVWLKPTSLTYRFTDESAPAIECTNIEDVPEFIRDKVAVLQIASDDTAILDVGVRISATTFWVFA
jgi:hypothetical protein